MYEESIWTEGILFPLRPHLPGNIRTEVVIIGGGLAGILTAYFLKQKGVGCVVVEAQRVGSGQTKHTTAKVTSQHGVIYSRLVKEQGVRQARQYAKVQEQAIQQYQALIEAEQIECDWERCTAYLYTQQDPRALRQEWRAARAAGIQAQLTKKTELPFPVEQALVFPQQAKFHPLKFLQAIAEKVTVYERTRAIRVYAHHVETNHGTIQAKQIVFACHYPFQNRPGYFFLRMHQERSYVIALHNAVQMKDVYLGIDNDGLSFRGSGDVLLLGGGNHRTGEHGPGSRYEDLLHQAETYWSDCEETCRWSAQDCMTLDGIPYIGRFSRRQENWYVATGFGKWGITSSMVSAQILSQQICGKTHWAETLFTPFRLNPLASARNFLEEGKYAAGSLLKQILPLEQETLLSVPRGEGKILTYQGKKIGVYRAEDGALYAVSVKCPHLGCQLKWNRDEKSWDCPCHGSRFDFRGRILDGPAQSTVCQIGGKKVFK